MDITEEKNIIKKARNNPGEFGQIFDAYYPKIFGYILRRTLNVEHSRDLASEVFYKALKNLWQFRWRGISISSWLFKIATNQVNAYFRKSVIRLESYDELKKYEFTDIKTGIILESELLNAEQTLQKHQEFINLQSKISSLPPKYQDVLTLRYFEEKSIKEISEILNKKEGTVKSLISRGLNKLRIAYEKDSENATV
jgi:RNA polymerase sigma-70 factor (ECF subfamily)